MNFRMARYGHGPDPLSIFLLLAAVSQGCGGRDPATMPSHTFQNLPARDLARPAPGASAEERIAFYVVRLGDRDSVRFLTHDDQVRVWYETAEVLGYMDGPVIPELIEALKDSNDAYERTMIFYSLMLAAQRKDIRAAVGDHYPRSPSGLAYPAPEVHDLLKVHWMSWWDVHKSNDVFKRSTPAADPDSKR